MKFKFIVFVLLLFTPFNVFAQNRGPLRNVWSSWVNVSTTQTKLEFPYPSRDVVIQNGSSTLVCVNIKGATIPSNCIDTTTNRIFQINDNSELTFLDYETSGITLKTTSGTASPVTVIVTY